MLRGWTRRNRKWNSTLPGRPGSFQILRPLTLASILQPSDLAEGWWISVRIRWQTSVIVGQMAARKIYGREFKAQINLYEETFPCTNVPFATQWQLKFEDPLSLGLLPPPLLHRSCPLHITAIILQPSISHYLLPICLPGCRDLDTKM